ncbi:SRPBCC family protein [Nakamurella antarctica]|uniref:SRPBCC family protein n=1 Tax=Nakamurella antarctica TaxID=1902245 RepID=A0A3G8ZKQ5_9ACTN|nr:SRPBCC family protein [Nakamurella antarctica]AZI57790.1 SRPBCC family protein [Nakamurella antarctica]
MADSSSQTLTIKAPAKVIMDVIADFAAYPAWTGAVKQVEITKTGRAGRADQVKFVMDAGMIKDTYELRYDWAADGTSVTWDLVSGSLQKAQHGSYVLVETGGETSVTYTLSVELTIPMIGLLRRKAEKVILDTALKELRKRVENA